MLQTSLDNSQPTERNATGSVTHSAGHPVLETLETDRNKSPIVLNQSIIDAVKMRLVDRYADVPF